MKLRPYQNNLIEKTKQAILDGYKAPCIVSPAGSGKTVVLAKIIKGASFKKNHTLFLVHRKEIIDQVRETLIDMGVDMNYVELGMVQTIVRRLDNTKQPAMIVVDESHHIVSNSYKKIVKHFNDALVISFTATPIRLGGSGLGDVNDILIEEVSVKWLIENEYLAPYKYYAPKLIDTEILKLNNMKEFSSTSIDKAINENKIYGDVIKHYKQLASGEQAIVYCHSVEASQQVAAEFKASGIDARHIDGKTNKDERDEVITEFRKGNIKIITNVDLIGEGVNMPDCSTVIMLRPTQSLSLFIQQSMRGMRYRPDKTSIIIDHVDNVRRHGLPDMEREWSLEGKKQTKGKAEVPIRECTNCFAVYPPDEKACPECGHVPEVKEQKGYEVDEAAEVEEVDESELEVTLDFRKPEDCKSMKELYELAKNRSYKPGWAYYQGKRLGFIS
jgi:superfamily II DNA or RNA helicase